MSEPLLAPGTPVNLDNCHREPIRTPGGVQAHGALLAADAQSLEIVQVSENASSILGRELLGATLGGAVIAKLAQRRLGVTREDGGAFFGAYDAQRWKAFKLVVERHGAADAAAVATFEDMEEWVCT